MNTPDDSVTWHPVPNNMVIHVPYDTQMQRVLKEYSNALGVWGTLPGMPGPTSILGFQSSFHTQSQLPSRSARGPWLVGQPGCRSRLLARAWLISATVV